jgi:DNA-binding IclR family transcriptional regulator
MSRPAYEIQQSASRYTVTAVARALSILDLVARRQECSLNEVCTQLGMHKSTAFRMATTLTSLGYLERNAATGLYRLGLKLTSLDAAIAGKEAIHWYSLGPLQDLVHQCGETAHAGVLYGGWAVTVQVVEGPAAVRMRSWVGKRTHAHCSALGKVLLAHRSETEVRDFVRRYGLRARTPHSITDPRSLKRHLHEIRKQGYAVDNEEVEDGLRCVAVPVSLSNGHVVASVSVSGPASRLTPARDQDMVFLLREAASKISAALELIYP